MELLKLENFADALLDKYETKSLNESLTESFVKEWWGQTDEDPRDVADEYGLSVKALSRSGDETLYKFEGTIEAFRDAMDDGYFYSVDFNEDEGHSEDLDESCEKTVNECSEISFGKEELTETVARSPRYELEDLGNLIEDAKLALEDKDMENMYLFGHAIYEFIEENKDELNDVVIDELGNLQDELETEAQKLDESCEKKLDEGFSDNLFNNAVNIVEEFIEDTFDSGDIPSVEEVETQIKENMGEFNGLVGDQAEIIDVAATYFDLPSIVDAAIDDLKDKGFFGIVESVEDGYMTSDDFDKVYDETQKAIKKQAEEDKSDLDEQVEDVYWYSNSEFKEDLAWLANNLTDYFFKEMESAHWGLSKKDITNIFNGALNDVLKKMRESDECTLFESKEPLKEDTASARPNHMAIIDMLESGYLDYKETCEELLRWMPDSELGRFIEIYADFEDLEESVEEIKPTHRGRKLHSEE